MQLALTEAQTAIRDEAAKLLADAASSAHVRAVIERSTDYDDALWALVSGELGWCALPVPEAQGGLGLGCVELAILMEETRRRLAPVPVLSTLGLALPFLLAAPESSARADLLAGIAAGTVIASLADSTATARRHGDGFILHGASCLVSDGAIADEILLRAHLDGDGAVLFAVRPGESGVAIASVTSLDPTRGLARLTFDGAQVRGVACLGVGIDLAPAVARARIALAAECLGGAQSCLDITMAYIAERVQFGRRIASFQAIKHRCAELSVRIETARSAVMGAAFLADAGGDKLVEEAAFAKALAAETFCRAAEEAIQLHGGVGFTWEYDPQLFFKRAQANAALLGSSDSLYAEIAETLLGSAA